MKYLLLLLSFNAFGAELIVEQGRATTWFADTRYYTPASYGAIALRTDGDRFIEIIQGAWEGVNNSRFAGLSLGGRTKGKYFAEATLGGVYLITPETTQLNGHGQFLIAVGIGGRFDNLFISGKFRHFSNGNTLGSNRGIDFFVLSGGVEF